MHPCLPAALASLFGWPQCEPMAFLLRSGRGSTRATASCSESIISSERERRTPSSRRARRCFRLDRQAIAASSLTLAEACAIKAAHPLGEFEAFEFDLRRPVADVQDLRIAAPDLMNPPARFDLILCRGTSDSPARASWEPVESCSPFRGGIELRLSQEGGQRWWTLRGRCEDGRFLIDPDPSWNNVEVYDRQRPIDAYRMPLRDWGFDLHGDGIKRLEQLRDLPRPAGDFRLEAFVEGAQPAVFEVSCTGGDSVRALHLLLSDPVLIGER